MKQKNKVALIICMSAIVGVGAITFMIFAFAYWITGGLP